ncbi:MAG: hypothetical protein CMJ40_09165 [Phycisphaerae bacterium]|nr:hypothetical protein [Phycisphaerae bacterium]|tara:strand:+ start:4496 stop:5314 length:819 start_codon:yes stop_codon:yes gene_type:complete
MNSEDVPSVRQDDRRTEAIKRLRDAGLGERTDSAVLWRKLLDQTIELMTVNRELAKSNLALAGMQNELDDLRQFIMDHDTYGSDFSAYTKVVEETRRQARAAAIRERRAREEAQRQKQQEARRKLDESKKKSDLEKLYDEKGFAPVGQDVYTSRSAFFYAPYEGEDGKTIQYRPTRFGGIKAVSVPENREVDYSSMTISGSVLNGTDQIRNIGVAFTFFDENGNQVGAEIVEIQNARPNVPYPYTRTIDMALNRPFTSHSTYVLYADQVVMP